MKDFRMEDEVSGPEKKKELSNASEAFDSLLESVGSGGVWQWKVVLLCSLSAFFLSFPAMSGVFLAATPEHMCDLPFSNEVSINNSSSLDQIRNFSIPWVIGKDGTPRLSHCHYYDRNYEEVSIQILQSGETSGNGSNNHYHYSFIQSHQNGEEEPDQLKCSSWIYDDSIFKSTVVTEWDLVCDDQWKKPSIQSIYMLGWLIGGLFSSAISDRFGRRPSAIACAFIFVATSIATSFSNTLDLFILFRFLAGASGIGTYLTNFVIVMEISGKKHRNLIGHCMGTPWLFGCIVVTILAYFLRDWRTLQLAFSIPCVAMFTYWFMPESPRWLLMQGRFDEGVKLLKSIGKANGGKELPKKEELDFALNIIKEEITKEQKQIAGSFLDKFIRLSRSVFSLVRTPNMRRRTLIVWYNWFVVSMCYYGVAFSGENINVSLYNMSWIAPVMEIPAKIITYYSAVKLGRRFTLCTAMCSAGACCIFILLVPLHMGWLKLIFALLGRMFLGSAFTSVYFFATELVPTNIRNISIGTANMYARIGSSIAPFIVDLMGQVYYAIPSTIFGVLSLIAGLLAFLLPETSGFGLPESIQDIENLPR